MIKLFLVILTFILIQSSCHKGDFENKVVEELNSYVIELPSGHPPDFSDEFIESLTNWNEYNVIGLGEATHGTKNFFELKHRLFKYLAENKAFKVLAYEFSFRASLKIDDYIVNGRGNIDSLFTGELWIQDNAQVKNLVLWMSKYNKGKNDDEKIHFIGIDNQLDAFYPEKTIELIEANFPELIELNEYLTSKIVELEHINYKKITKKEFEFRKELFQELLKESEIYFALNQNYKDSLKQKVTIHLIESLIKSNQWLYNIYTGNANNRDMDLANNVLWAKRCYGAKLAVWAHNAHVQNNPNYYSEGEGSMGKYLKDSLGNDYLIAVTSFSKGQFKAVMEGAGGKDTPPLDCEIYQEPIQGSVNEIFNRLKYENFFLDLNKINNTSLLYAYLDTLRPMLGVGDFYAGSPEPHYTGERVTNLLSSSELLFYFSGTEPITFITPYY